MQSLPKSSILLRILWCVSSGILIPSRLEVFQNKKELFIEVSDFSTSLKREKIIDNIPVLGLLPLTYLLPYILL